MSGRIRTIKPEILENKRTAGLSSDAFRLFIGCILQADDYGNLYAEPEKLQGAIFWACAPASPLRDILDTLASVSLLSLYTVRGQLYGHVVGWSEHQKVDKPSKPRVPGPEHADALESHDNSNARETLATPSRDTRETLAPDLRSPISDLDPEFLPPARAHAIPEPPPPAAPPSGPRQPSARLEVRVLDAIWFDAVKLTHKDGLSELAAAIEIASLAKAPPADPETYARQLVPIFVEWVNGVRANRRPQKTPRKMLEHLSRLEEIAAGTREIRPAEDPPAPANGKQNGRHEPTAAEQQAIRQRARRAEEETNQRLAEARGMPVQSLAGSLGLVKRPKE